MLDLALAAELASPRAEAIDRCRGGDPYGCRLDPCSTKHAARHSVRLHPATAIAGPDPSDYLADVSALSGPVNIALVDCVSPRNPDRRAHAGACGSASSGLVGTVADIQWTKFVLTQSGLHAHVFFATITDCLFIGVALVGSIIEYCLERDDFRLVHSLRP